MNDFMSNIESGTAAWEEPGNAGRERKDSVQSVAICKRERAPHQMQFP